MSVAVRPRPDGARPTCPFCREEPAADVAPCACGVVYHPECRAELSRCATIGCAGKSAAPGQRAAHRDVACVRCQGLINNDGDMCFGCWSAFHRTCLAAGGCCGSAARRWTAEGLVLSLLILLCPALFCGRVGWEMSLINNPNAVDPDQVAWGGAFAGALIGLLMGLVALLVSLLGSRERT